MEEKALAAESRLARLLLAFRQADDKAVWLADKLAWRRFWRRARHEHAINRAFDLKYGTDTAAEIDLQATGLSATVAARANGVYRPLWESEFHRALKKVGTTFEGFTFLDLGSGKGKLLLLAADYPFKAIIGVEHSPVLHATATSNIVRFKSTTGERRHIEAVLGDATSFALPEGPVVCFIFNSFDQLTMRMALRNIEGQLAGSVTAYVVYVNVRRVAEAGTLCSDIGRLKLIVRTRTVAVFAYAAASKSAISIGRPQATSIE